jgi:hypothetical protein
MYTNGTPVRNSPCPPPTAGALACDECPGRWMSTAWGRARSRPFNARLWYLRILLEVYSLGDFDSPSDAGGSVGLRRYPFHGEISSSKADIVLSRSATRVATWLSA